MRLLPKKEDTGREATERRNRLLALLHIAKKDLSWSERFYRDFLDLNFQVPTAAALTNDELAKLLQFIMREWDWSPKWRPKNKKSSQVAILRKRILGFVPEIPNGEKRIKGLCRKLCNVDRVEWCNDVNKLKRLLATLGNIQRKERE